MGRKFPHGNDGNCDSDARWRGKIRNSKSEIRNKFKTPSPNVQNENSMQQEFVIVANLDRLE